MLTCARLDDWQATFHRIPKAINQQVEERRGSRLCDIGLADAANSDMFSDFDSWGESVFWPAVTSRFGSTQPQEGSKPTSAFQVEVSSGMRASTLGLQLQEALVLENQLLTQPGVPAKRLIQFQLPSDMTYQCGDYLAVLPVNPSSVVRRAIRRFDLPWDAMLCIQKTSQKTGTASIPLDTPISAFELLSTYVEMSQPASKRDLNTLADAAVADAEVQAELRYIASSPSRFAEEVVKKRASSLDLLMRYPSIQLSIGDFLAMLPPMRVRQYSISSSPLTDPSQCSITIAVLNAPLSDGIIFGRAIFGCGLNLPIRVATGRACTYHCPPLSFRVQTTHRFEDPYDHGLRRYGVSSFSWLHDGPRGENTRTQFWPRTSRWREARESHPVRRVSY